MIADFKAASLAREGAAQIRLTKIRQTFERPLVADIEGTIRRQFLLSGVEIKPGAEIAVAVGSRGIANLSTIVRTVVELVKERGARPFIFPAMGSHGGATAEGQRELLASFSITEEAMGCPLRSSMEVVELPNEGLPHRLYMDRHAHESDGVIVLNRIKPHTDFHGRYESGLAKMCVIGLGKERQAFEMHRFGTHGLRDLVPKAAARILASGKVLLGIGIVENACDETAFMEAIAAANILEREVVLLDMARRNMPRLPVDDLDLLIVDHLGKNISGTGMDTNIIGRVRILGEPEPAAPRIKSIVVSGLSEESHGNATGIGLADVVTRRLVGQTDFAVTYTNIVTSGFLERAKLPVVAENDAQAIHIGLRGAGHIPPGEERIARIRDTLHLSEIYVSDAILRELSGREGIEVLAPASNLVEASGELADF